jgi:hypothetical protein
MPTTARLMRFQVFLKYPTHLLGLGPAEALQALLVGPFAVGDARPPLGAGGRELVGEAGDGHPLRGRLVAEGLQAPNIGHPEALHAPCTARTRQKLPCPRTGGGGIG